jgi:hypothetical protein
MVPLDKAQSLDSTHMALVYQSVPNYTYGLFFKFLLKSLEDKWHEDYSSFLWILEHHSWALL